MENDLDIEIAPFDNLLVYKKGYTADLVEKIIKERKLGGLRIFSVLKEDRLDNLDFLSDYTFLEKLDITSALDYDFGFLKYLSNLRKLSISTSGDNVIDLSDLNNLFQLTIKWRKQIIGLNKCISILTLVEYNETDFSKIEKLTNLTELYVKTSSVKNLNGLHYHNNLTILNLGNCKRLQSIEAISQLTNLKILLLEKCNKITDYNFLAVLESLEVLKLVDCGEIPSLKFVEQLPLLDHLSLLGKTLIVDGSLLPARHIKSIEYNHTSHYNIRLENLSYEAKVKNNLDKIKKPDIADL